jgi:hypothetical protein
MPTKTNKVDLTLLKKLVGELESSLTTADGIKTAEGDVTEYIVELSKAAGLTAGVMQEAGMLIGDIQSQVMQVQSPGPAKSDFLEKLLGGIKGGGLTGGGNTN